MFRPRLLAVLLAVVCKTGGIKENKSVKRGAVDEFSPLEKIYNAKKKLHALMRPSADESVLKTKVESDCISDGFSTPTWLNEKLNSRKLSSAEDFQANKSTIRSAEIFYFSPSTRFHSAGRRQKSRCDAELLH
jgi:hypothetical protein